MNPETRVLLLGAAGQVGAELLKSLAGLAQVTAVTRRQVDLADATALREVVRRVPAQVIVNAAAYTAVDRAESEPDLAMAVNGRAPGILAEEALRCGALLVHYSTDYVFDGTKRDAWKEDDAPNPLNVYGRTKLSGEEAIRSVAGAYLIFRTSWVYGPEGKNFLLTMLRLGRERERLSVVDDQFGAPTSSLEVARATLAAVERVLEGGCGEREAWAGLYHMSCGGATSWHGFAEAIFDRAERLWGRPRPTVDAIPSSEYPTPAKRPRNSVLSTVRLRERFGVALAPWEQALDDVLWRAPN